MRYRPILSILQANCFVGKLVFMDILINGLSLGAVYALIALGYTMVYGIAKMLNFAHGDIIMVGAYTIFVTLSAYLHPLIGLALAVVLCVVLGVVVERLAYRPLRGASPLAVLITAIGVSYSLQSVAQLIFKPDPRNADIGITGTVTVFGSSVKISTLIALAACLVIMVALLLFIKKTRVGRAMLAVSEDRGAAALMGIDTNFIIMLTFAIGSALAACASFFYLMRIPSVEPTLGSLPGIKAFTAAVIGGIGSVPGAMIGGILLGIIECIALAFPAINPYTGAIEFALLIIILLVRPVGLLGKKRREKV